MEHHTSLARPTSGADVVATPATANSATAVSAVSAGTLDRLLSNAWTIRILSAVWFDHV
jgi:hypothetical protein